VQRWWLLTFRVGKNGSDGFDPRWHDDTLQRSAEPRLLLCGRTGVL